MKYKPKKKQNCQKTCDLCEPLPHCSGLSDNNACKIKIKKCEKQPTIMRKCKRNCEKDGTKPKPLCQKTCCNLR